MATSELPRGCTGALSILAGLLLAIGLAAQPEVPQLYELRAAGRLEVSTPVKKSIESGLRWLAKHQEAEGYWHPAEFMKHDPVGFKCTGPGKPNYRVGVTGLALLAFLADGHTSEHGEYSEVVRTGIDWLLQQQATEGPAMGRIGPEMAESFYGNLLGTYALVEAYGLSRADHLEGKAQAAVDYLQRHRHPEFAWRYRPHSQDADTPLTVLAFTVLRVAEEFDLQIDPSHAAATERFLKTVTSADGVTGYHKIGAGSSRHPGDHGNQFPPHEIPTLTAAALTCRFLLGQRMDQTTVMKQQAAIVSAHPPSQPDLYYWYYGSLAMRQVGGAMWTKWSRTANSKLLSRQRKKHSAAGSWDIDTVWGPDGGRVYTTAMALLTLQTPYRYARIRDLTPVPTSLARFAPIRRRWIARDFGGVLRARNSLNKEQESLSAEELEALAALDAALNQQCNRALLEISQLGDGPDFLTARDLLRQFVKEFLGLPPAELAKSMLGKFTKSKGIQREIAAMSAYRRAVRRTPGRREALQQLATRYDGTHAAALATKELARKKKG